MKIFIIGLITGLLTSLLLILILPQNYLYYLPIVGGALVAGLIAGRKGYLSGIIIAIILSTFSFWVLSHLVGVKFNSKNISLFLKDFIEQLVIGILSGIIGSYLNKFIRRKKPA